VCTEQETILQENKDLVDVRDKCRAVEAELMTEMTPGKKWMNQMCSLNSLIEIVVRAFPENDELAQAVLKTLPNEVVERGVLTEVSLKKRFEHVEQVAQRLALLRNEGPYPGAMYLASYLRSMLTLQSPENPAVQPEGLDEVDNMDILYRAR
jgi:mitofilin